MRTREELLAERLKIDTELQHLDRREMLQKALGNMGVLVDAVVADPRLGYELSYERCVTVHTKDGLECRVFPVVAEIDLVEKPDSSVIKLNVEIYF